MIGSGSGLGQRQWPPLKIESGSSLDGQYPLETLRGPTIEQSLFDRTPLLGCRFTNSGVHSEKIAHSSQTNLITLRCPIQQLLNCLKCKQAPRQTQGATSPRANWHCTMVLPLKCSSNCSAHQFYAKPPSRRLSMTPLHWFGKLSAPFSIHTDSIHGFHTCQAYGLMPRKAAPLFKPKIWKNKKTYSARAMMPYIKRDGVQYIKAKHIANSYNNLLLIARNLVPASRLSVQRRVSLAFWQIMHPQSGFKIWIPKSC